MKNLMSICAAILCVLAAGSASAGIVEDLTHVEIVSASFGTVPQGQSKTVTFELRFGLHIRDYTFQVTNVPAPFSVSPMTGTIDGTRFTWSVTLPASAVPGDYTSPHSASGAFQNAIVVRASKAGQASSFNVPISCVVTGFPYAMTPDSLDFGLISNAQATRTFQLKRIAFGDVADSYQITATEPFTVSPASGALRGSMAQVMTVGVRPGTTIKNAPSKGTITIKDVKSGIQKTVQIQATLELVKP